ncbi:MAG: hypothetical protein ACOYLQ_09560 [Hyphomicrobiaceae bacterium]
MQSGITVRSYGATGLGLLFAGITGRVLLDDVVHGAPVTVAHMMSIGALIATLAAGHYFVPALRRAAVLSALGLAVLFLAGTGYVLVASATRNAETAAAKAAAVKMTNSQRVHWKAVLATAEADLEHAKGELADATNKATAECGSGKGRRCDGREGIRSTAERARDRAQSHVDIIRARLEFLGPEREEAGGYAHAGRVWAALAGGSAERATGVLVLTMPILTTLLCELGTVVFLSIGLGHRHRSVPVPSAPKAAPAATIPGPAPGLTRHEEVASFVRAYRAKHGRDPRWIDVRAAGFSRATASRGLRKAVPG